MDKKDKRQLGSLLFLIALSAAVVCVVLTIFFRTSVVTGVIGKVFSVLEPFFWGIAIAYLLHPVCEFIERYVTGIEHRISKKHRPGLMRMFGIVIALLLFFAAIILLILAVLPQLVTSINSLISRLPSSIEEFQAWIMALGQGDSSNELIIALQNAVETLGERLQNYLQTDLLPNLSTLVNRVTTSFMGLLSVLKNFGLGCIIAIYILASWERFVKQAALVVYGLFPKRAAEWIREEVDFADQMFSGFIRGKLLDSLIIGVICLVFCLITRMPYAVLISVIVGVTNVVPFFGPYIGAIPSALLILTVSPVRCVVFVVFIIVLQQVDGNYIGPAILGDRLGISGIWILFSILVFSSLWGILGMLIGVPVFAVIYDLIRKVVFKCLKIRGQEARIEEYEERFH